MNHTQLAKDAINAACPDGHWNGPRLVEEVEKAISKATSLPPMTLAMALAESRFANHYFLFARGKDRPGEPLYGFAVFPPVISKNSLALVQTEHDDPVECVRLAIAEFDLKS